MTNTSSSCPIQAFDAVFFIATNKEGFYLIIGAERRNHGIINGLFYLLTPDRGLLCNRKIPDTILFGAKKDEFGAEGILLTPVDAMRKWSVKYHGEMRLESDPEQVMNVKLDAEFDSDLPYFNFDTDLHPSAMCRAFAKEDWTKEYFNNLKSAHQTHYEQMGNMHGSVEIDGTVHQLELQAFRDHSYVVELNTTSALANYATEADDKINVNATIFTWHKRDWDLMHRYAFHMLFLENGMRASIGVICQPCTCSLLESGYVYTPNGELHPLEWCDFKLYQHGEGGTPPVDYAFQFKAGGTVYTVKAKEINQSIHFKGWKWEARMVERFLTYEVNGVLGKGVSEFHYHSSKGRSKSIARDDPGWFQDVIQKS
uniref:Uncharacterized protein n=1 Tax=Timema shepardi TaxID=629360 RepID=A0A7R9AUT6_TIMSH|nr:unnamed protein product [Timema shepardi]